MNIRLEYSETKGRFKQAQGKDPVDHTDHYKILCCFVVADRATRFIQAIHLKYPELELQNQNRYPSHSTMKHEVFEFISEDLKLQEEYLNRTFKRRGSLFNNNNR